MKVFALLGEHLGHSYSPIIQKKLFEQKGLDYDYKLLEIKKDEIKETLDKLRSGEYAGFNVTIPYKREVMQYLDEIKDEALAIGAVNTIKCENGKLVGYNTDYYGFSDELKYYNIDVFNKTCYVLGTGGASLAVKKALGDLGGKVVSVSRTKSDDTITYDMLDIKNDEIVVNTTPLGMYPNVDASPLKEEDARKALAIIFSKSSWEISKSKVCGFFSAASAASMKRSASMPVTTGIGLIANAIVVFLSCFKRKIRQIILKMQFFSRFPSQIWEFVKQ